MQLCGDQVKLIQEVAKANRSTVVVLNNGSSLVMSDWLDQVPAVLECWYPGQECGNAIADVLFGDCDPSGRLTQTFPERLEDNPAFINYPGDNGQVRYGEGIFVGYRYYDKKRVEPLFPFGHGNSYTQFEYAEISLQEDHYSSPEDVECTVEVRNIGARRGTEVVQLYIRHLRPRLTRPEQELKDFAKITLDVGQSEVVRFNLAARSLAFYDPQQKEWLVEPGDYELRVGSSSRDIRATRQFSLIG
jgi:beta-glucosidase|tara:strand:- start:2413 stop:3150 length:738 start_codon:yes stop_codon:yes gene_type:complete